MRECYQLSDANLHGTLEIDLYLASTAPIKRNQSCIWQINQDQITTATLTSFFDTNVVFKGEQVTFLGCKCLTHFKSVRYGLSVMIDTIRQSCIIAKE